MGRLEQLILATPGLHAGAESDSTGQVIETDGEHDFETLCATFAMCRPHLETAVDLLALGNLHVASFLHGDQSVFAHVTVDRTYVYLGGVAKSPDATAQKLISSKR